MKCHFNPILSIVWLRIWFRLYDTYTVIIKWWNAIFNPILSIVWLRIWFRLYDTYTVIINTWNAILIQSYQLFNWEYDLDCMILIL